MIAVLRACVCNKGTGWDADIQLHLVWMEPKEKHRIHEFPGRSFLDVSQRQRPSGFHVHLEWRVSGTRSLLVDRGHGQLPSMAEAATGDLFSQVLFGNSVWGLGVAGSFWVIAYPGGGGRPRTTAFPRDPSKGKAGSQVRPPETWSKAQGHLQCLRTKLHPDTDWAAQIQTSWAPWSPLSNPGVTFPIREVWVLYTPTNSPPPTRQSVRSISWNLNKVDDHLLCNVFSFKVQIKYQLWSTPWTCSFPSSRKIDRPLFSTLSAIVPLT